MQYSPLSAKYAAIAVGVLWGGIAFFGTALALFVDYGNAFWEPFISVYPGYSISLVGIFLGGLYGFFDGFLMAYVVVRIYNWLIAKK